MNFSKKILTVAVASACGMYAGVAFATLDDGAGLPVYFASELASAENATANGFRFGTDVIPVKLGGAMQAGQKRFVRLDLTGLKFGADLTSGTGPTMIATGTGAGGLLAAWTSGGAKDTTSVILSLNNSSTTDVQADALINLVPGGTGGSTVLYTQTAASGTIRYRLYETETCAANPDSTACLTLKDKTGSLFATKTGVTLTATQSAPNPRVTTVDSQYTKFKATDNPQSVVAGRETTTVPYTTHLGTVAVTADSTARNPTTGSAVALSEILGAGSKLIASGDFSAAGTAAGQVRLDINADCTTAHTTDATSYLGGTVATDKQSASFTIGQNSATLNLCYSTDKAAAIQSSYYKVTLSPVAAASSVNVTNTKPAGSMNEIKRDGVELQATFGSSLTATANRIICTNTNNLEAKINKVTVFANTGIAPTLGTVATAINAGTPSIIPAAGRLALQMSELVTGLSTGTAFGLTLNIGADAKYIKCTYQLLLPGSDVQTVVQMVQQNNAQNHSN